MLSVANTTTLPAEEKAIISNMNIFIRSFIFRAVDMPMTRFFYTTCLSLVETYTASPNLTTQIAVFMAPQRGMRPAENHPLSVSLRFEASGHDAIDGNHVSAAPYQPNDNTMLVFYVSDLAMVMQRVHGAGLSVVTEPVDIFGVKTAIVLDPNGYRVRVTQLPSSFASSAPGQRSIIPDMDCRLAFLQLPCLAAETAVRWYDQTFSAIVHTTGGDTPFNNAQDVRPGPDGCIKPINGRVGLHAVDKETFLQLRCSYFYIAAGDRTVFPSVCYVDSVRQQTELKHSICKGISVHVPDLTAFWNTLPADGHEIVAGPRFKAGVGNVAYLRDPAGLVIEVSSDARTVRRGNDPRVVTKTASTQRPAPTRQGSVVSAASTPWTCMVGTNKAREHRRKEDADLGVQRDLEEPGESQVPTGRLVERELMMD
ncbi:Glyoxalase-like domain [Carpediemonas membranifera]|uniref:Glyoxalase-like domain n=1 Tax=Carpediemonas membranifera TaxID=201153 RepID=A0A8J6DYX7_9EUKA|nr:Glyoxalase-like domain [Carpediemonas membranifera]|eukprot:KAG9392859.1 Glyoxalase-like domain [Carpediemonas membranifera]